MLRIVVSRLTAPYNMTGRFSGRAAAGSLVWVAGVADAFGILDDALGNPLSVPPPDADVELEAQALDLGTIEHRLT